MRCGTVSSFKNGQNSYCESLEYNLCENRDRTFSYANQGGIAVNTAILISHLDRLYIISTLRLGVENKHIPDLEWTCSTQTSEVKY